MSGVNDAELLVSLIIAVVGALVMACLHAVAHTSTTAGPSPGPTLDPALHAFAKGLKRVRRSDLTAGTRIEGLLRGERVSATVWPLSQKFCAAVRIEAVVPVPLTETFVRGPTGPKLVHDREPQALFREPGPDLALRTLLQRADEVKIGLSGVEASSREPLAERSLAVVADALITLAGFVRTDPPPQPDPVARLIATRTRAPAADDAPRVLVRGAQVCPFCRDGIDASAQDAVACEGCATLHHADCWAENGRCTVRGCERGKAERVSSS